jgi:hypothetical protein
MKSFRSSVTNQFRLYSKSIPNIYCNPSFIQLNQPCILTGIVTSWEANKLWQIDSLWQNYGQNYFECGFDVETGEQIILKFEEFLNIGKQKKLYLFDATFEEDCPDLLEHYNVPLIFQNDLISKLPNSLRPNYRWFLVGLQGTVTKLHVDPLMTNAWNALVVGIKEWILISPDFYLRKTKWEQDNIRKSFEYDKFDEILAHLSTNNNVNNNDYNNKDKNNNININYNNHNTHNNNMNQKRQKKTEEINYYHFLQKSGEIVYIPQGWFHAVKNITNFTVGVTHNFIECERKHEFLNCYLNSDELSIDKKILLSNLIKNKQEFFT